MREYLSKIKIDEPNRKIKIDEPNRQNCKSTGRGSI